MKKEFNFFSRNKITNLSFTVIFLFGIIFCMPNISTAAQGTSDRGEIIDQLFDAALENGSVRIIVQLNVDDIKKLTSASNSFTVKAPGKSFDQAGLVADLQLKQEISNKAGDIVNQLSGTSFKVNRIFSTIPYMVLSATPDALIVLADLPQVLSMEQDLPEKLILPVEGKKNIPKSGISNTSGPDTPSLNNTAGIIGADDAWGMGYTGSGWYVAILDTGIRPTHNFFSGKTIIEKCYSGNLDCPDNSIEDEGAGSAAHYASSYAGWDHGTHVAGIATGNNGSLYGIAKDSNIIAVQVFSRFLATYPSCGGTACILAYTSDQLSALEYIYSLRSTYSIASVNMSLGGGKNAAFCDSDSRKAAIDNLRAAGIATAIATGNEGYCGFIGAPACISSSISVGASTDADVESSFNNWHPTLQRLFAPGSLIYSSTGDTDSSYESWNGTSMATPHVAGAWALMRQAHHSASVDTLYNAVEKTGTLITTGCGGSDTRPRINVDLAIKEAGSTNIVPILMPLILN